MYNKLFAKILDSSIWLEPTPIRIVWVTLIAAMDQDGYAHFSAIGNLAARARVSVEDAQKAVECFIAPDPGSGDDENDGRRIERVPGGFFVLNAKKYKDIVTAESGRASTRERVRRYRENQHNGFGNGHVTPSDTETESEGKDNTAPDGAVFVLDGAPSTSAKPLSTKRQACPVEAIVGLYHEICPELPRCVKLTPARRGAIQQRWREDLTDLDDWRIFFTEDVKPSDFLMGRARPTNGHAVFRATLAWLVKQENYAKIIEGNYVNGKAGKSTR